MDGPRRRTLAAIAAIPLLVGVGYWLVAAVGSGEETEAGADLAQADLMVRAVDRADPHANGRVFLIDHGRRDTAPGGDLECERVYFSAGRGLCLGIAPSGVEYEATIFDSSLRPVQRLPLTGIPSRARVSPDGRYGAMTVFVNGHAYSGGGYSTTTTIVDMQSGKPVAELEQLDVFKDGRKFDAVDFNFWGVTFADDSNRFYATLHTADRYYLVEGDLRARRMRVLRDGIECPSLSPDGTRIAFKSRIGSSNRWQLRVLSLATLADHVVAERRSIDDQAEWLDDRTLVYSDGLDVFSVPAGGGGAPELVMRDATSPVSLRKSASRGSGRTFIR
jgi:hypothetical protein